MRLDPSRALAGLLTVVLVLVLAAACGPSAGSVRPERSNVSEPSGTVASTATASGSGDASGRPAGSAGGTASGDTAPEVWLPDWADETVPDAVAHRRPLPFCGIERPPAPQPMVFVDRLVRLCFQDAAAHGEEAEWVSIQGTMEGGTVATVYRALADGTVEVFTDWTQDPFGAGGWTRMTCREVVEAEGDELVGVLGCDEAVAVP